MYGDALLCMKMIFSKHCTDEVTKNKVTYHVEIFVFGKRTGYFSFWNNDPLEVWTYGCFSVKPHK